MTLVTVRGEARRPRVWVWVLRYLPAELAGAVTAVLGGVLGYAISGSAVLGAVTATLGENVGYYAVAGVRSWAETRDRVPGGPRRRLRIAVLTARAMVLEFEIAEVVDTVVARPLLMYLAALALDGEPLSWLVGKIAADVLFYAIVIASFEAGRRKSRPLAARREEVENRVP